MFRHIYYHNICLYCIDKATQIWFIKKYKTAFFKCNPLLNIDRPHNILPVLPECLKRLLPMIGND